MNHIVEFGYIMRIHTNAAETYVFKAGVFFVVWIEHVEGSGTIEVVQLVGGTEHPTNEKMSYKALHAA